MKLLIIEDDTGLNRGISFAMEQEGYAVVSARTLREGEALFAQEKPDAVILVLTSVRRCVSGLAQKERR